MSLERSEAHRRNQMAPRALEAERRKRSLQLRSSLGRSTALDVDVLGPHAQTLEESYIYGSRQTDVRAEESAVSVSLERSEAHRRNQMAPRALEAERRKRSLLLIPRAIRACVSGGKCRLDP
jgi:hypothetical protein